MSGTDAGRELYRARRPNPVETPEELDRHIAGKATGKGRVLYAARRNRSRAVRSAARDRYNAWDNPDRQPDNLGGDAA